jgi:hypothetical protein
MVFFAQRRMKRLARQARELARSKPVQQPVGRDFVDWVEFGKCPDCGAKDQWQEGPSGGSCINFRCAGCGNKFNVAMPPLNQIQRIG